MVKLSRKAAKQAKKLPFEIVETLGLLVRDLTHYGPETSG
jgi:hypothetical protein